MAVILSKPQFLSSERYMHIFNMSVTIVRSLNQLWKKLITQSCHHCDKVLMIIKNISKLGKAVISSKIFVFLKKAHVHLQYVCNI